MGAVGGQINEVTYNHPTLGSGVFFPKADSDSTFILGGLTSADDDNMVDATGGFIDQVQNKRCSFEVDISWDNNDRKELEKLQAMQASTALADWTFTHVSGAVYKLKGKPVGDLSGAGKDATIKLKVAGGGKMSKI